MVMGQSFSYHVLRSPATSTVRTGGGTDCDRCQL
jgi:hypothetical protein